MEKKQFLFLILFVLISSKLSFSQTETSTKSHVVVSGNETQDGGSSGGGGGSGGGSGTGDARRFGGIDRQPLPESSEEDNSPSLDDGSGGNITIEEEIPQPTEPGEITYESNFIKTIIKISLFLLLLLLLFLIVDMIRRSKENKKSIQNL